MKRNIIFLTVLSILILSVVSSSFYYTVDFKKEVGGLLEKCSDYEGFDNTIGDLQKALEKSKFINVLIHPKNVIEELSVLVKTAKVMANEGAWAQARAQIETAKELLPTLF